MDSPTNEVRYSTISWVILRLLAPNISVMKISGLLTLNENVPNDVILTIPISGSRLIIGFLVPQRLLMYCVVLIKYKSDLIAELNNVGSAARADSSGRFPVFNL